MALVYLRKCLPFALFENEYIPIYVQSSCGHDMNLYHKLPISEKIEKGKILGFSPR
jgi:hypothetical protein